MIEIVSIVSIGSLCLPIFSSGIVFPLTAAADLVLLGLQCYLNVEYISLEAKAGLNKLWNPADLLTWGCFLVAAAVL